MVTLPHPISLHAGDSESKKPFVTAAGTVLVPVDSKVFLADMESSRGRNRGLEGQEPLGRVASETIQLFADDSAKSLPMNLFVSTKWCYFVVIDLSVAPNRTATRNGILVN
jgi:hypothetical protein